MGDTVESIEDEDILRQVQKQGRIVGRNAAIAGLVLTLIAAALPAPF